MLKEALQNANLKLQNNDILVIASKVVAFAEGGLRPTKDDTEFRTLIKNEADAVFDDTEMMITLKNDVLIPNAGIDNSNTPEGEVVLWPKDSFKSAREIRQALMQEQALPHFGVLISDSHCQPLRWGTTGLALGWAGFEGVQDERGSKDLYGREMQYTRIAMADSLASTANLVMGETDASIPFAIIRGLEVHFTDREMNKDEYKITLNECIYKSVYSNTVKEKIQ